MPEGDTLHRAARSLQALVGERLEVETPHPRAAAERIAERLDGRRLIDVQAVGKNVLLRFEGGLVLRSHLRMSGSWRVVRRGTPRRGRPWLVLRGTEQEAVLWRGPVLELHTRALHRLGPDILADPPELEQIIENLRANNSREIGEALLDQRVVAGIGNMWKAEALWRARISPWDTIGALRDDDLREVLEHAARLMLTSVETGRESRKIYRRAGRGCPGCGTAIRARGQGEENRTAYWCPQCQKARPTTLNHA